MQMETQYEFDLNMLREQIALLECRVTKLEEQVSHYEPSASQRLGWEVLIGLDADNPLFESAERAGREWRESEQE